MVHISEYINIFQYLYWLILLSFVYIFECLDGVPTIFLKNKWPNHQFWTLDVQFQLLYSSSFSLCIYSFVLSTKVPCLTARPHLLSPFIPSSLLDFALHPRSVSFSKYESCIISESRTAAKTVDSSVWSKWESWALPELTKGGESARWARRTMVMGLTFWSGEREGAWGQNPLSAAQAEILCLRSV